MLAPLKRWIKHLIALPPNPAMSTDNLYAYLDALYHKRDLPGPVLEVGCATGGTTAFACRFLSRINRPKEYYCFDTFAGFVADQLEDDFRLGLPRDHAKEFSNNSEKSFRQNLRRWGISRGVQVVKGDICKVDAETLPQDISVALIDVDLRDPVRVGMEKVYPRLADGGILLVDDCKEGTTWVGANRGYLDFMEAHGLPPRYYMGLAVLEKPGDVPAVPWETSDLPNPIFKHAYC